MRVVLSVEAIAPPLTGVGRYCWELTRGLSFNPLVTDLRFYRNGSWIDYPPKLLDDNYRTPARRWYMPRSVRAWRNRRLCKGSVFHGPNFFLPRGLDCGVITVHDLSVRRYPATHPPERIAQFTRDFERSIFSATHIIADSETIRREIIQEFGVAPDRVTAIALGVSPEHRPRPLASLQKQLKPLALEPGRYGLCVSTFEPRKRIDALLNAWAELPAYVRSAYPLVLAGGGGWLNEDLHGLIENAERSGWLRNFGYVPEDLLRILYCGARLFVYPSAYEGFGLPPIEAMASGVPTIVSNSSCLPEVTRGAAMLVDPDDISSFRRALERGLEDDRWRFEATVRGLEVSSHYTWDRCVQETVSVYHRVAGGFDNCTVLG